MYLFTQIARLPVYMLGKMIVDDYIYHYGERTKICTKQGGYSLLLDVIAWQAKRTLPIACRQN